MQKTDWQCMALAGVCHKLGADEGEVFDVGVGGIGGCDEVCGVVLASFGAVFSDDLVLCPFYVRLKSFFGHTNCFASFAVGRAMDAVCAGGQRWRSESKKCRRGFGVCRWIRVWFGPGICRAWFPFGLNWHKISTLVLQLSSLKV